MKIFLKVRSLLLLLGPVLLCLALRYIAMPLLFEESCPNDWTTHLRSLASVRELASVVDEYDNPLAAIRKHKEVPALYAQNLPPDLDRLPVEKKTEIFILLMLPHVLRVNEEIRDERQKMENLIAREDSHTRLTRKEQWWLNRLAWRYGCDPGDFRELRRRVDEVPVSLALAQAIEESGWGTSRFAVFGNALYGQHLPRNSPGEYMMSRYGEVKVAAFPSMYKATRSYMNTLNSGRAYSEFRTIRSFLRKRGESLSGVKLAAGLAAYSERGERYVRNLKFLIDHYMLERFNAAVVQKSDSSRAIVFERSQQTLLAPP